jgi:predicted nuclease of predicted toxin-antitoxin system
MRFLFDQNISHRILGLLPEFYAHSTSIKAEGMINSQDLEIWEYAKANNYTIITQDSDFNDLNALRGFTKNNLDPYRKFENNGDC